MAENSSQEQDALAALRIPAERKRRARRRLRWLRTVALVLLLSAAAAALLLRGRWDPVEVEVAVAQRLDPGAPRPVLTAGGYVIPHRKVELAPKITGRVEWIGVEKGDRVPQGRVLLRIEQREFRAASERAEPLLGAARARLRELETGSRPEEIERARAQLEEARSNVMNAELDLKRFQQLSAEGAIARQSLDAAQNRYEVALAQRAAVEKNFELVRVGPRQEQIDLARAQVREAEATPKILVPREAVLNRDGQRLVYLANGTKAVARPISMGSEVDGRVEILQGLQGGESGVVRGAEVLRDGQRVRVKR